MDFELNKKIYNEFWKILHTLDSTPKELNYQILLNIISHSNLSKCSCQESGLYIINFLIFDKANYLNIKNTRLLMWFFHNSVNLKTNKNSFSFKKLDTYKKDFN
jgi:hypothetical protein